MLRRNSTLYGHPHNRPLPAGTTLDLRNLQAGFPTWRKLFNSILVSLFFILFGLACTPPQSTTTPVLEAQAQGESSESSIKIFTDFYTNNTQLAIVLVSLVGGMVLTKLVPALLGALSMVLKSIGKIIGGRLAYRGLRDAYLNWVVLSNQDLNLTGIIGSENKPKLEQIFISLRVSSREGEPQDETQNNESERSALALLRARLRVLTSKSFALLAKLGVANISRINRASNAQHSNFPMFELPRLWKSRQVLARSGIQLILFGVPTSIVVIGMPFYALILQANLNTILAGISFFIWVAILGFALTSVFLEREEPAVKMASLIVSIFMIAGIAFSLGRYFQNTNDVPIAIVVAAVGFIAPYSFVLVIAMKARKNSLDGFRGRRSAHSVGRLLSKYDRVAILGKPGAGKSTYAQYIALTLAQDKAGNRKLRKNGVVQERLGIHQWFLPIVIPLRKVSGHLSKDSDTVKGQDIMEVFFRHVLPSSVGKGIDNLIYYMLSKGQCLFLLDGLDEVADREEFQAVTKEITGLTSRYPGNRFIVTSRFSGWRGGPGSSFSQFEIEDLRTEDVLEFVHSWYQAIEENRSNFSGQDNSGMEKGFRLERARDNANRLIDTIRHNNNIMSLAENPLLLSMICFVHYHKTLPKERLSLYQDCSNLLLAQWDQEKGFPADDTNLTFLRKELIIQEIAIAIHSGKIGAVHGRKDAYRDEIIPLVKKILLTFQMDTQNALDLFQKLIDRSGIIVAVERMSDRYAFSHLTFQEFYTAKHFNTNGIDPFGIVDADNIDSPGKLTGWWREVVLLYSAIQVNPSGVVRELCSRVNDSDPLNLHIQIAAQCIIEAAQAPELEVESYVLSKISEMRQPSSKWPTDLTPEVKRYLLLWAARSTYYHDSLALVVRTAIQDNDVSQVEKQLLGVTTSEDSDQQIAALDALGILVKSGKSALTGHLGALTDLLADPKSYVRWASAKLILAAFPDNTQTIISVLLENLRHNMQYRFPFISLTSNVHELFSNFHEMIILNLSRSSSVNNRESWGSIIQILKEALQASILSDGQIRAQVRHEMSRLLEEHILSGQTYEFWLESTVDSRSYVRDLAGVMFECLDQDEQNVYREHLMSAHLKGKPTQQAIAVELLAATFQGDEEVQDVIIASLKSPYSNVRLHAVQAIGELNLDQERRCQVESLLSNTLLRPRSLIDTMGRLFKEDLLGVGEVSSDSKARVKGSELFLSLSGDGAESVGSNLIAAYNKLPLLERWSQITEMPDKTLRLINTDQFLRLINLYESDCTSGLDKNKFAHADAIRALGRFHPICSENLQDKITALILDQVTDDDLDGPVLSESIRLLNKLNSGSSLNEQQRDALVRALESRNHVTSGNAFDIIMA
jgi:HEAT repeat protein